MSSKETKPIFVGSTRGIDVIIMIPLGLIVLLSAMVAVQSLVSGAVDWTLVEGFAVFSLLFAYFAVQVYLSWRYEFYEDSFLVKHRGRVEAIRYSDIDAWYAAKYVPMAFHRLALRIEVKGRKDEITLNYVPYNRRLRTYLSEYLEQRIPSKRVK